MIICRTPFRVSLFGGGSDYPPWYLQHGGCVLGFALNKYCSISLRELPPFFAYKHRVVYSLVETVNEIDEMRVSKIASVGLGILAVGLGIAFENQNVAYMVGLAFAVAASCNFPVLLMSVFWKGMTTRGAFIGGFLGLFAAVGLVVTGPTVWVKILGNAAALQPYDNVAIFSMPIAFIGIWIFSLLDGSARAQEDKDGFEAQYIRCQTGIGAAGASAH